MRLPIPSHKIRPAEILGENNGVVAGMELCSCNLLVERLIVKGKVGETVLSTESFLKKYRELSRPESKGGGDLELGIEPKSS